MVSACYHFLLPLFGCHTYGKILIRRPRKCSHNLSTRHCRCSWWQAEDLWPQAVDLRLQAEDSKKWQGAFPSLWRQEQGVETEVVLRRRWLLAALMHLTLRLYNHRQLCQMRRGQHLHQYPSLSHLHIHRLWCRLVCLRQNPSPFCRLLTSARPYWAEVLVQVQVPAPMCFLLYVMDVGPFPRFLGLEVPGLTLRCG